MNRRCFIEMMPAAATAAALPLAAQEVRLPRAATPLDIVLPDGTKLNTSKYAGKVCLIEFLFTTCSHCQEAARHITALYREYGPKGFQPVGAAFNDGAMMLVPGFVKDHQVGYPVGVVHRDRVLQYLNLSPMSRLTVPLVAFVDRRGQIRYQSNPVGTEVLHEERRMRQIIEELLKEGGGPARKG